MHSALTPEEIMEWRRTTEKITLEEFAQRLGKSLESKKETKDLHDIFLKKKDSVEEVEEKAEKQEINKTSKTVSDNVVKKEEKTQAEKPAVTPEKQSNSGFEIKITFNKKLNKREEVVFNYFCKNRKQKVSVNDLASLLGLPNDYVYKYIKNLRSKIANDVLVNADKGGYILNI